MEKWKIAVIAGLLLALFGFGIYNNGGGINPPPAGGTPTPAGSPTPSPYIGKTLPPWNFKQWNGPKTVTPTSIQGKTALIEIFRIDCPHCQDAAPFMVAIQQRYGPRGLQMLGIQSPGNYKDPQNDENNWTTVQGWLKERGIKYPIAFDEGSKYFQGTIKGKILNNDSNKLLYPTILIVQPNGTVAFGQTGHDTSKAIDLAVELEKRLPSSKPITARAQELAKWLRDHVFELQGSMSGDPNLLKALSDDIEQRLKEKPAPTATPTSP